MSIFGGLEGQPPDVATQPSRLEGGSKAQRTKNLAVSSKKSRQTPNDPFLVETDGFWEASF